MTLTNQQIIDAIDKTIEWIKSNPDNHISGVCAINSYGKEVHPQSPDAACFCAVGYIIHSLETPLNVSNLGAYLDLLKAPCSGDIWNANDEYIYARDMRLSPQASQSKEELIHELQFVKSLHMKKANT